MEWVFHCTVSSSLLTAVPVASRIAMQESLIVAGNAELDGFMMVDLSGGSMSGSIRQRLGNHFASVRELQPSHGPGKAVKDPEQENDVVSCSGRRETSRYGTPETPNSHEFGYSYDLPRWAVRVLAGFPTLSVQTTAATPARQDSRSLPGQIRC